MDAGVGRLYLSPRSVSLRLYQHKQGHNPADQTRSIPMAAPAFDHAPALRSTARPALDLGVLSVWASRARTRAQLRDVAPERLADLGLDAAQVQMEAAKPFWRA